MQVKLLVHATVLTQIQLLFRYIHQTVLFPVVCPAATMLVQRLNLQFQDRILDLHLLTGTHRQALLMTPVKVTGLWSLRQPGQAGCGQGKTWCSASSWDLWVSVCVLSRDRAFALE